MKNINAIIFDLGGVLLNIDYHKTSEAFGRLGVSNFDKMYSQAGANTLFSDLETGKVTQEDFCAAMKKCVSHQINDDEILSAWNALLLDFRIETLEMLRKIKGKYRTFLLSNTNGIHAKAFEEIFKQSIHGYSFESLFDKIYYSHDIGFRKPNKEAYEFVLNDSNLIAAETLFIDDSIQNIEGAKAVGLQTVFLQPGMKVEDLDL